MRGLDYLEQTGTQETLTRLKRSRVLSSALAGGIIAVFAAETAIMLMGVPVYGSIVPPAVWWAVHAILLALAVALLVFVRSRLSKELRRAELPTADRSVLCIICSGMIRMGSAVKRCECGKSYHGACAEALGECPKCGRALRI